MASHRTLLAAAVTIAALCGLAGFALGAGSNEPPAAATSKPKVRTQVIHRTVHVKRKRPARATIPPVPATGLVATTPPAPTSPARDDRRDDDDHGGHGVDDDHGGDAGDDDRGGRGGGSSGHGGGDD